MGIRLIFKRYLLLVLLILTFVGGAFSQYTRIIEHKENDHWVYYRTAKRVEAQNINDIYTRKDGALPFRYSPVTMIIFSWMSHFDESVSRKIWLVAQALLILASFSLLYSVLIKLNSPAPLLSITLSFLLFYRYFLDALYCGQIAGAFFFALVLGLYYWVGEKKNLSNLPLLFLMMLKIVPGFMIMLNFITSKNRKEFLKMIWYLLLTAVALHSIYFLWFVLKFGIQNISKFIPTFTSWIKIALADNHYFDGSTSKSQSLRGVLLRLFGSGEGIELIWKAASLLSLFSLFIFWYKVKLNSLKLKVFAYLLGILVFVLVMPESLPYQIFNLLIPIVFIFSEFIATLRKRFGLILFCLLVFCALPTTDIVGSALADSIQYKSLPFWSFVLMGGVILQEMLSEIPFPTVSRH